MNRWLNRAAVVATLTLAAGFALGQGGGPRGPGGMGRGGLFQNDAVKKELKLTADQIKKIEALNQGGPGGQRGPGAGQAQGQRDPQARAKAAAERDAKIKGILNAAQYKRYHELRLQQMGPLALGDPETAKKLGLNKTQQDKIAEIQGKVMESLRAQFQGGGQPDRAKLMAAVEKARAEANTKVLAVLTAAQKKSWTEMLGKPFKFNS